MKINTYVPGAGAADLVGPCLNEDIGRMVKKEDLAEVKRLYQRALGAMANCVTETQGWLKRMAGEMVRRCVETRCVELDVDIAIDDLKFTTALTYAACRPH